MNSLKTWIMAIRPKTLGASIAPVFAGTVMVSELNFNMYIFILTLLGALILQVGSNLANDYFDFKKGSDTKERLGPTRVMASGLVNEASMKRALLITFTSAVLVGSVLVAVGGLPILIIGVLSIICALAYTAGPYPLAYYGLGDLFVFIFFGPASVMGTAYLQTGTWNFNTFLVSIPLGLLSVAILVVNNVRDEIEDVKNRKFTLVARFGGLFGKLEYSICILFSFLYIPYLVHIDVLPVNALFTMLLIFIALPMVVSIWKIKELSRLNPLLANTAKLLIGYSLFLSVGWLI